MVFDRLFGSRPDEEEYVEIEKEGEEGRKINVMIESLDDYMDVERILKFLREGSIVFLRIKPLRDKDLGELKRSVARLKKTVSAIDGDIVGIDENFLVLTPQNAKVYRGETPSHSTVDVRRI